jgi:hypothetical protein
MWNVLVQPRKRRRQNGPSLGRRMPVLRTNHRADWRDCVYWKVTGSAAASRLIEPRALTDRGLTPHGYMPSPLRGGKSALTPEPRATAP